MNRVQHGCGSIDTEFITRITVNSLTDKGEVRGHWALGNRGLFFKQDDRINYRVVSMFFDVMMVSKKQYTEK